MKINTTLALRRLPAAVALLAAAGPGVAQSQVLEEVIVTAQKRVESLMDVPLSVSAVSGDKMLEAGIRNLGDLTAYVPNFQKSETSIGNYLSIRGISSGINQGFEQSVGMYIDGVYAGRGPLAAVPTTMDLERVEILKVLYRGAKILIMDEPTAVLAPQEIDDLIKTMRSMVMAIDTMLRNSSV